MRRRVRASDKTCYRIFKDTGISQSQLSRFLSGEKGLSFDAFECIARCLALEIKIRLRRRKRS